MPAGTFPEEAFSENEGLSGQYQYNMVSNPGPLVEINKDAAGTFRSGLYNIDVSDEEFVLYRAGNSQGKPFGNYYTFEPPESVAKVRIDLAVKEQWINPQTGALDGESLIDCYYAVRFPAGVERYIGPVGYQNGVYLAGTELEQIYIHESWNIGEVIGVFPLD